MQTELFRYICAAIYGDTVKFKLVISKKLMVRFLFFTALTCIAFALDSYFEKHPVALEEMNPGNGKEERSGHGIICLFTQAGSFNAKTPAQRVSSRKFQDQAHIRHIQQCHQLRNHLVLKAETEVTYIPLFLSYHHLIFRHYYFSYPDDDVSLS